MQRPACKRGHAAVLLLLALAAASCTATAAQTDASNQTLPANPDYYTFDLGSTLSGSPGGEVYTVCVSPWSPFVFYNKTTNTLSGYEWDLFLAVAKAMGLSFDARVMGWNEMMNNLALNRSDPNHCDIAPTSIPVTPDLVPLVTGPKTVKFSIPTYHSGYAIATAVSWAAYDRWSFGRVFTVQLWMVLLGTATVLALLTYAAEHDYAKRGLGKTKYPTAFRPGMYEAMYNCVGKLFNVVQDLKVTSLAGKLISMGWGFLVLVTSTTYTAGVTAALTSQNFQTTISSVTDLPHYRVITWDAIVHNFLKYGFIPLGMPWLTETDGKAMLSVLASGKADALVLDYPWLRYQLATRCDLAVVGQPFHYVDNAVGLNPNLDSSFISAYNIQLVNLKQAGMYEEYQDKYLKPSQCPDMSGQQMVVTFKQLEGLWIILGAFVGLAIALLLLPRLSSRFEADIQRTHSMFDIRGMGKSFANMARRSIGRKSSIPEDLDLETGTKAVEMADNPSFVPDVLPVKAFQADHCDDPAAELLTSRKVPEPSRPTLALDHTNSVLPFRSDLCPGKTSILMKPEPADLEIHVGAEPPKGPRDLDLKQREPQAAGITPELPRLPSPHRFLSLSQGSTADGGSGAAAAQEEQEGEAEAVAVHAALEELKLEEALEQLTSHDVHAQA